MENQYPRAKVPLKVVIVGAGIAGLAAALVLGKRGHDVHIIEVAPEIAEVGAGIQVAPNMLRLLDRWGVGIKVRQTGVALQAIHILRWQEGALLGSVPINQQLGEQVVVHRADLQKALLEKALAQPNVRLQINTKVENVRFSPAAVELADGSVIQADVVLAADGIKSSVRGKILGDDKDVAVPTGDAVFRVVLTRDMMSKHADLLPYINEKKAIRWVGPGRHIIAYPVRNHEIYNMALAHPDRGRVDESWTTVTSKKHLLGEYEGWDPMLIKMLNLVPEGDVLEWKLCMHMPLLRWVQGSCALLEDACHPMLPYVAQGAAQGVEDGASLGVVLSSISSKDEIQLALKAYEKAQKARAEHIQQSCLTTRIALHLPDGPEQVARDQKFKAMSAGGASDDKWGDPEMQRFLWSWDAEAKAEEAWRDITRNSSFQSRLAFNGIMQTWGHGLAVQCHVRRCRPKALNRTLGEMRLRHNPNAAAATAGLFFEQLPAPAPSPSGVIQPPGAVKFTVLIGVCAQERVISHARRGEGAPGLDWSPDDKDEL
ncbi:FAD-dependent monooxygenase atnJ [Exophiala dermatitidis]